MHILSLAIHTKKDQSHTATVAGKEDPGDRIHIFTASMSHAYCPNSRDVAGLCHH